MKTRIKIFVGANLTDLETEANEWLEKMGDNFKLVAMSTAADFNNLAITILYKKE